MRKCLLGAAKGQPYVFAFWECWETNDLEEGHGYQGDSSNWRLKGMAADGDD